MDATIVIDDDFTLDVVEEDDEEFENGDSSENLEFVNNTVHIKEEIDIDFEDNYIMADRYVNFADIETEIKLEPEDEEIEEEILPVHEEFPVEVVDITIDTPSDSSSTSSDVTPDQEIISNIQSADITSADHTEEKKNIDETQDVIKKHTPPSDHSNVSLDRRKPNTNTKKKTQLPTKTTRGHGRQMHHDKSVVPFKFRNKRKSSPPKFHRNYGTYRNDSLVSNSFFTRNSQHFYGSRSNNFRSTTVNGFQNHQSFLNSHQTSSVDWQTYSTILAALNQLLGNNQNPQLESDNSSVSFVHRKRHFSRSRWRNQLRNRPQVWTNEYENKAPSFDNSTQLQMYTTILSAVTQLNNGVIMQDGQNYTTCLNNVTSILQMSFLNVLRSF